MGSSQSAHSSDRRGKKRVEFDYYNKSTKMIEKYIPKNKGLNKRYINEHKTTNGHLDWAKVLGHRKGIKGMGYTQAINTISEEVERARVDCHQNDRQVFDTIDRDKELLISLREEELDPECHVCGCVIYGGEQYDKHKYVIDAYTKSPDSDNSNGNDDDRAESSGSGRSRRARRGRGKGRKSRK